MDIDFATVNIGNPLYTASEYCIGMLKDAFMMDIGECIMLVRNVHVYFLECIRKLKDCTADEDMKKKIAEIEKSFGESSISKEQVIYLTYTGSRLKRKRALESRRAIVNYEIQKLDERIQRVGTFMYLNEEGKNMSDKWTLKRAALEMEKNRIDAILRGVWTHAVIYDYIDRFEDILKGGSGDLKMIDDRALNNEINELNNVNTKNLYTLKRHRRFWERSGSDRATVALKDIDLAIARRQGDIQTPSILTPSK